MLFGPVPLPLPLATYSLPPVDTNAIGINSVGTNPIGSVIPFAFTMPRSLCVSSTAIASDPIFAAYNRVPSAFSANAFGSAPK